MRFIRRARSLEFSMAEIAKLLKLWQNRSLEHLAHSCHGDQRPDCRIIDALAD